MWQEQQEDNSKGNICYLENICGTTLNVHHESIEDELNIDGGKHIKQLMNEVEYLNMKNYGNRGGSYPSRPQGR